MRIFFPLLILLFLSLPLIILSSPVLAMQQTGTVTDIDGTTYQTVRIGNQLWMVENLKVTRFNNGDVIPIKTANSDFDIMASQTPGVGTYANDEGKVATYGRLYNWYAVTDGRGIAPAGFHVSTYAELTELATYLGTNEGGKLKETGTTHWDAPNTGATNEYGFTALPGGIRTSSNSGGGLGYLAYFWTSTQQDNGYGHHYYMTSSVSDLYHGSGKVMQSGLAVRCLKVVSPTAELHLFENSLQFGRLRLEAGRTLSLKIKNSYTDTLFIDSVHVQSTASTSGSVFTVLDSVDQITNTPADSMLVNVQFSPLSQASYTDSLIIYYRISRDSTTETSSIFLSGEGTQPIIMLSDTIALAGDTLGLPISFSGLSVYDSIFSFDFALGFDTAGIDTIMLDTTGTISAGFLVEYNFTADDTFTIAGAGADCILTDGVLIKLKCVLDSSFSLGDSAKVEFGKLEINDGMSFSDTVNGLILYPTYYGDVSKDIQITSYDASLILQHYVRIITLDDTAFIAADVTGDGSVRAFDASFVLRHSAGFITSFPAGEFYATPKALYSGAFASLRKDSEDDIYCHYSLYLNNVKDIFSSSIDVKISGLELESLEKTGATENYISEFNTIDGQLLIGIAGYELISGSETILRLKFKKLSNDYSITLNSLSVNEVLIEIKYVANIPKEFALNQNYPNPFNPETAIKYQLPMASKVSLKIYNLLGQEVRTLVNETKTAGYYQVKWNGTNNSGIKVSSGIYFYTIRTNTGYIKVRKMILLR